MTVYNGIITHCTHSTLYIALYYMIFKNTMKSFNDIQECYLHACIVITIDTSVISQGAEVESYN